MLMIDSEGFSISFKITSFLPDLKCFSTCCSLCGGCFQTRETSESFTFLSKPTVTFFFFKLDKPMKFSPFLRAQTLFRCALSWTLRATLRLWGRGCPTWPSTRPPWTRTTSWQGSTSRSSVTAEPIITSLLQTSLLDLPRVFMPGILLEPNSRPYFSSHVWRTCLERNC